MNVSLVDKLAEQSEEYLTNLLEDIINIQKAMKIKHIKQVEVTIVPKWKEKILVEFLKNRDNLISRLMQDSEIKKHGKDAVKYAQKLLKSHETIEHSFPRENEYKIVTESSTFIESNLGGKISVKYAEESNSPRKHLSEPFRPALFIE